MFARLFLVLCAIALFNSAVFADEEVEERANPAVKVVAKILGKVFAGAAAGCLMEAANNCKSHWKNPKAALSCGKQFLKDNQGRCAAGK